MAKIDPARQPSSQPLIALGLAVSWAFIALWLAADAVRSGSPGGWSALHAAVLGVLGHAVAGAALQFGTAALGASPPFTPRLWWSVLGLYNLGLVLMLGLVSALNAPVPSPVAAGLAAAGLAGWTLPMAWAIARAPGPQAPRVLLAIGLSGLALAGAMGALRLMGVYSPGGVIGHAALGLLVGLASILMGATKLILPTLLGPDWDRLRRGRWPFRRRPALATAWMIGAAAVAGAIAALAIGGRTVLPAALALLVVGGLLTVALATLLPIAAFLQWWALRERVPHGRQVPGIGTLQPEWWLWAWLALHAPAALGWGLAFAPGAAAHWRIVAFSLGLAANLVLAAAFLSPCWRARRFLSSACPGASP